jgi:hypothetical protein
MWNLVIAVFIGSAAALTYFVYLLQSQISGPREQVFILLYLVALFSAGTYWLLFRFALPRLRYRSRRVKLMWVMGSFIASALLLLAIPVRVPTSLSAHRLEITATGQKNQAAQGSELWVIGFFRADGIQVNSTEYTMNGEWEVRDGMPLSYQHQPATLAWQGALDGDVQLRLLSHPWSGVVTVTWDGVAQTIDLYSPTGTRKDMVLPVKTEFFWQSILVFLADAISLGTLILVISIWLTTRPIQTKAIHARRWAWVGYAAPCIAIWSIYLLAFWPGLMTFDSLDQWQQILTGRLNDAHPFFHTITNWLITRIWLSPSMVALAQIMALSVIAGLILMRIRQWGAPRWVVWLTCLMVAVLPANGILVNAVWKDIPYAIAVLLLTLFVLQIIQSNGQWLSERWAWVWLALTAVCVALYRHNGAPVAFGTLAVLFFAYRHYWKRLALASLLTLGIWLGIRGPVFQVLNVQSLPPNFFTTYIALKHVAAHLNEGAALTETEQALLRQVRTGDLEWPYLCSTAEPLLYDGKLNSNFALAHSTELTQLAWKLFLQRPQVDIEDQVCSGSLVWRLSWPPTPLQGFNALPFTTDGAGDPFTGKALQNPNAPLDLTPSRIESPVPTITKFLTGMVLQMLSQNNISWLWRPALYLYILLAASAIAALRSRRWKFLLVGVPIVLNSLVIVMTLAQEFRYQYPVVLVSILFSLYFLFGIPLKEEPELSNAAQHIA